MSRENLKYDPVRREFIRESPADTTLSGDRLNRPAPRERVSPVEESEEEAEARRSAAYQAALNRHRKPAATPYPYRKTKGARQTQFLVWVFIGLALGLWIILVAVSFLNGGMESGGKPSTSLKDLNFPRPGSNN